MTKELIVIEENKAHEVFTPTGIDTALATVRTKVAEFEPDLSTATSRKAIGSMAYKVSRSKTAIETIGKSLAKDVKDSRAKWSTEMDIIRDEVRKPLDDWETEDQKRVDLINERIEHLQAFSKIHFPDGEPMTVDALKTQLLNLKSIAITKELFGEFIKVATETKDHCKICLEHAIVQRQQFEDDQAELQRLRDEEAARLAAVVVEEEPVPVVVVNDNTLAETAADLIETAKDIGGAVAGEIENVVSSNHAARYEYAGLPQKTETPAPTELETKRAINQAILADVIRLTGLPQDRAKLFVADLVIGKINHVSVNYE